MLINAWNNYKYITDINISNMDVYNSVMDIHYSVMYIHDSIRDIQACIMGK